MKNSFELKAQKGVVKKVLRAASSAGGSKRKAALPKVSGKVLKMLVHGKRTAAPTVSFPELNVKEK